MRMLSGSIIILAGSIALTGAALGEKSHSSPGSSELASGCAIFGGVLILVGIVLVFLSLRLSPGSKSRENRNYFLEH